MIPEGYSATTITVIYADPQREKRPKKVSLV